MHKQTHHITSQHTSHPFLMLIIKHSILCFCFSVIYLLQEQYEKINLTENWMNETKSAEINDEKTSISATGMELKGVKHIATCVYASSSSSSSSLRLWRKSKNRRDNYDRYFVSVCVWVCMIHSRYHCSNWKSMTKLAYYFELTCMQRVHSVVCLLQLKSHYDFWFHASLFTSQMQ